MITQHMKEGPSRWVATGAAAVTCAGLAGYLYLVDPNNPANAYPKCPMKALTGLDCPGCGGLRATHSMVHGDIAGALHHNALAFVIVPVLAYVVIRWVFGLWGKDLPSISLPRWAAWAVPIGMLVFSIVRNIPNTPFFLLNSGSV